MDASLIIPSFERPGVLVETLRTVASVDNASRLEVIVVDDGSSGETLATVLRWIEDSAAPVRLLRQDHRGPSAARNRGARAAVGKVLIFLDNDCLVRPDFVDRHLQVLRNHPGCWVVGRVVHPPELRRTPFGRYRDDCFE